MVGVCIVLLYRMTGVLNIAQAAVGAFGTMVHARAARGGRGFGVALLAGVLAAAALAGVLGGRSRGSTRTAPLQVRTVVTAAVLVGLLAIGFRLFGNDPRTVPSLLPGAGFRWPGSSSPATRSSLLVLAVGLAVGAGLLLNRSGRGPVPGGQRPAGDGRDARRAGGLALAVGVWAVGGRDDGDGGHRHRAHTAEQLPQPVPAGDAGDGGRAPGRPAQPRRHRCRRRADRRRRGRGTPRYPRCRSTGRCCRSW